MKCTIVNFFVTLVSFYLISSAILPAQQLVPGKCAIVDHLHTKEPDGINHKVENIQTRTSLQTSILSPSRHFRIHYDTIGINAPALVTREGIRIEGSMMHYVDSVAKIFDSVWTTEVTILGFAAPAPGQGEAGGEEIDIYIENLDPPVFGRTDKEAKFASIPSGTERYICSVHIDNDYRQGYRTLGMDGLKVTAAHEFFHVIQLSRYGYWSDERYFYEMTAESMESIVFPTIKDYIFDLRDYFANINNISIYTPFTINDGYGRAIWSLFLMKRYGTGVMREIFENIGLKPVPATKFVLESHSTTLAREYAEYCYWNYFTGYRSDSVKYYSDAGLYPVVTIRDRVNLHEGSGVFQKTCLGFGVNYLQAIKGNDTATFVITNVNMNDALAEHPSLVDYSVFPYQLSVSSSTSEAEGMNTVFSVGDTDNWKLSTIYNRYGQKLNSPFCFPNPYRPAISELFIAANKLYPRQNSQKLTVLSANYNLVYSGEVLLQNLYGSDYAVWNGKDAQGNPLASGVYIYMLSNGSELMKGKFAVIR